MISKSFSIDRRLPSSQHSSTTCCGSSKSLSSSSFCSLAVGAVAPIAGRQKQRCLMSRLRTASRGLSSSVAVQQHLQAAPALPPAYCHLPLASARSKQQTYKQQDTCSLQAQQLHRQQHIRPHLIATAAAAAAAGYEPSNSDDMSSSSAAEAEASPPMHPQQQVQQPATQLPPLDLPPSRSAALWLHDMSDSDLQQAAADWGYLQIGRPLPEGISLTALADTLPEDVFVLDLPKALGYLALSLAVMAAGYSYLWYWHSICPLWQQVLAWVVIGTGYYGAFQTAVDCVRFAFWPESPAVQDVLGAVLMAPALISYEVFRVKFFNHLMCTNQLDEDLDTWHPLLPSDLANMPTWQATLTALLMATPLKFFASIGKWLSSLEGFDLKLHPKQTRFWVWLSWIPPLGFIGVVWPALVAAGGAGSLVTYWLGPWLVFHCWLSVMSLIRHTGPHIPWAEEGLSYDKAQATVNGTVSVQVPAWLEVLLHHSNHNLASQISISIPSYNLPAAQAYLQQKLDRYLTTATINPNLLRNLVTSWLVYDEQQQRYCSFDEAQHLVEEYKQQQQQQQQQRQQERPAGASQSRTAAPAAAQAGSQRPAAITPSIPLEHLLGNAGQAFMKNGRSSSSNTLGSSSSSSGSGNSSTEQQQLPTSSSTVRDAAGAPGL